MKNYLKPQGTIGIVGLSSCCQKDRFSRGVDFLLSLGFKIKTPLDPSVGYGTGQYMFSCAEPRVRAQALESLFTDPEVDVILSARGGYGVYEVLPFINFDLLAKHPKPLIGFSDTSALLALAYERAGIPAIHGPSLESAFSKARDSLQAQRSANVLIDFLGAKAAKPFDQHALNLLLGSNQPIKGKLTGGNLAVLNHLMGTPFQPNFDQHILFLEDVGEKPYRIHRMLIQLKMAGLLNKLKGVLLGSFTNCEDSRGHEPSMRRVFEDIFGDLNYPVYGYAPFGHEELNLPLPYGANATISADSFSFS